MAMCMAVRSSIGIYSGLIDVIILDAPPTLAVTDTPVLTNLVDQVIVVVEAGRVPAKAAVRMREILAVTGRPIAGFVLNDKTNHGDAYGYYGYGYYNYGYYGEERAVPEKKAWWRKLATLRAPGLR